MCHPIGWKVNFRPLGTRSQPEGRRGGFQRWRRKARSPLPPTRRFRSPALRSPRAQSASAGTSGAGERGSGRGRADAAAQPFRFLPLGTGLAMSRLSGLQKIKTSHSFWPAWVLRFTGRGALCPGTGKVSLGLPSARFTRFASRPEGSFPPPPPGVRRVHFVVVVGRGVSVCNAPNGPLSSAPAPRATWRTRREHSVLDQSHPLGIIQVCETRGSRPPAPPPPYPERLERQILKLLAQRELLKRSQINMHAKLISCFP